MTMEECCATCKRRVKLVMFDYGHGGCEHHDMGYACMAFVDDGQVTWMVGDDPEVDRCECWEPKEG